MFSLILVFQAHPQFGMMSVVKGFVGLFPDFFKKSAVRGESECGAAGGGQLMDAGGLRGSSCGS